MFVKEFTESVSVIAREVCCDGGEGIASHNIPSSVRVVIEDDDADYELIAIVPSSLSCGCWDGIVLKVRQAI